MSARLATALVSTALVAVGAFTANPAYADTVGKGPNGQRLTVSKTTNLPLTGTTVTVSGSGYDTTKGIYVAFCLDNGPGAAPSPCGGGADMAGTTGLSHWISSNPPSYGEGLAVPYGSGGSFRVQLKISPKIGDDVDCTVRKCVVATRNDHTRTSDRSQDVKIPVTFAKAATAPTKTTAPAPAGTKPATSAGTGTGATGNPAGGAPATTAGAGGVTATAGASGATGGTGTIAGTGTTGPTDPVATTRVSESASTGRWWTIVMAGLGVLLVALVVLRARGRRREQS